MWVTLRHELRMLGGVLIVVAATGCGQSADVDDGASLGADGAVVETLVDTAPGDPDLCTYLSLDEVATMITDPADVVVDMEPENPFLIPPTCEWEGGKPEANRRVYVYLVEQPLESFEANLEEEGSQPVDGIGDRAYGKIEYSGNGDQQFFVGFEVSGRAFQLLTQDFPTAVTDPTLAAAALVADRVG